MVCYELYGERVDVLELPDSLSLVRRPEFQRQTGLTQTVWRYLTNRLPGRDALAPALRVWSQALKRHGTVGTVFFYEMRLTLFNGLAKDEEG
jgi:hypothetical protein